MTNCPQCGVKTNKLRDGVCLRCGGWVCPTPGCGRAKSPEQATCGRGDCALLRQRTPYAARVLQIKRDGR